MDLGQRRQSLLELLLVLPAVVKFEHGVRLKFLLLCPLWNRDGGESSLETKKTSMQKKKKKIRWPKKIEAENEKKSLKAVRT